MRNVYLRIHYGCDDRFKLVARTIRVCAPYFYQIKVTNFGPDKNTEKFDSLLKEFPNLQVVNLGKFYNMNITEDLLRHNFMDIPDGDWGAFLDSDWRFSPYFLEHMQEEIEICEQQGKNHLFSYQIAHYKEGELEYTTESLEQLFQMWENNPDSYGFPLLQKIDKKNIWTDGFMGNHSYILHVPYNKRAVPKMYHLHIRDYSDYAYCSTMMYQSWWYIGHNVFQKEEQDVIINSWEYDLLERFKHNTGCYTSNDFHEMKKSPIFLEKLKQLFLKFENSKIFGCQQMYSMASKYNMEFLGTDPNEVPCNGPCCNYKCGKIHDIPPPSLSVKPSFGGWSKITNYSLDEIANLILTGRTAKESGPDKWLIPHLGNNTQKIKVLDFGCGIGRNTFHIGIANPKWDVVGYDNDNMLSKTNEYFQTQEYSYFPNNVSFISNWDMLKTEKFDTILCCLVLQHIPPVFLKQYIYEFKKMTSRLIVTGRRFNDSIGSPSTWALLEECGLIPQKFLSGDRVIDYCPKGHPEDHNTAIYTF